MMPMNRREMMKAAGTGAALLAAPSLILAADEKPKAAPFWDRYCLAMSRGVPEFGPVSSPRVGSVVDRSVRSSRVSSRERPIDGREALAPAVSRRALAA